MAVRDWGSCVKALYCDRRGVEVLVSCRAMASGGSFWVKRES